MSRISRYVLTQLLMTFAMTLTSVTFVLMFGIVVVEVSRSGLGLRAFMRLFPYAIPIALRFAVPASILMATCSVFGRMSADNEVVATKSLGISPRNLLYPAFALALALSVGMVWMNDLALTWGFAGMRAVVFESVEEVVFRKLKIERSFHNQHFSINVKNVEGRKLIEPRFEVHGKDPLIVDAREAELRTDLKAEQLQIAVTDYTADLGGKTDVANSGTHSYTVPLSKATIKDRGELRVSQLGWSTISKASLAQQKRIANLDQTLAARAAFQMVLGNFDQLGTGARHVDSRTWKSLHDQRLSTQAKLNKLHLEPWRRSAEGFSCFFIVLVGAPLAVRMRTTNFFTTFAMCFFPVLCLYYPIFMWAANRVKDGEIPAYSVWISNAILFGISYWLTRGVVRY